MLNYGYLKMKMPRQVIFAKQVCKYFRPIRVANFLILTLLKENGVELRISENEDVKASIVEQFN